MFVLIFLLLVAAIVAILAKRLSLPYTVGLIVTGVALNVFPVFDRVVLTREIIFQVFLPPLIFEAAIHIRWIEFRKEIPVTALLATLGVVLSALITGLAMHYIVGWEFAVALLFGFLIAATDPVSVIAIFKEAHADKRLQLLVESESILNDGTSLVGFAIVLMAVTGGVAGFAEITLLTVKTVAGGILCGAVVAAVILALAGRTEDALVDIALTLVSAYGSFLIAEHFEVSGVLATMTAGLAIGNAGHLLPLPERQKMEVGTFWEAVAFVVNSFIFILIGVHRGHLGYEFWMIAFIATLVVIVSRAVAVYPCCALFVRSRLRVPLAFQHVLFWGGLRGAVALTLSLGLPIDLPHREEIVYVTFAVVSFSIIVQGLTMTTLVRKLGLVAK
jgi:monovalent cation:H+ antiporter, CPA1 family